MKEFLCNKKVIIADFGYKGKIAEEIKMEFGYKMRIIMCNDNKGGFKPVNKTWVIERTIYWFDNDRRLCRNYEMYWETS